MCLHKPHMIATIGSFLTQYMIQLMPQTVEVRYMRHGSCTAVAPNRSVFDRSKHIDTHRLLGVFRPIIVELQGFVVLIGVRQLTRNLQKAGDVQRWCSDGRHREQTCTLCY